MAQSNLALTLNRKGIGALLSLTRSAAVQIHFLQLAEYLGDVFAGKAGEKRYVCYRVSKVGHGVGECSQAGSWSLRLPTVIGYSRVLTSFLPFPPVENLSKPINPSS